MRRLRRVPSEQELRKEAWGPRGREQSWQVGGQQGRSVGTGSGQAKANKAWNLFPALVGSGQAFRVAGTCLRALAPRGEPAVCAEAWTHGEWRQLGSDNTDLVPFPFLGPHLNGQGSEYVVTGALGCQQCPFLLSIMTHLLFFVQDFVRR